jgi:hypothetical protein
VDTQAGGGQAGDQGQAGAPAFTFEAGATLLVSDEDGNPEARDGRQTKVSFGSVWNTGTASGNATVTISVDDKPVQSWTSGTIAPNQSDVPSDTYIHNCGVYPEGHHMFVAKIDPPASGYLVELDSDVDIAPPPNG